MRSGVELRRMKCEVNENENDGWGGGWKNERW